MIKKIWLPLLAALAVGGAAFAAVPEGSAEIISTPEEINQTQGYEYSYSSSLFSEGSGDSSSTMYLDDGYGRLTTFEMIKTGNKASLTIRQNGAIRWEGTYKAETNTFGVTRRNENGKIQFKITLGNHILYATVNQDDIWIVTESGNRFDQPVPLMQESPVPVDKQ